MYTLRALCLSVLLACGAGLPASARDVDTTACNAILEIAQYYSGSAVAYKFEGDDARKIIGAVIDRLGTMPMKQEPAAIVWIGLNGDSVSADIFFYDAHGCFVNYTGYWRPADILALLDATGVEPPFGTTFHQIPGSPGAHAGASI